MANMSYCRFENTLGDLEDCLIALRNEDELSDFEARAAKKMFRRMLDFCVENEIIDGYDEDAITCVVESLADDE